jgi:hypothetical protein
MDQLNFTSWHQFDATKAGITIPTTLIYDNRTVQIPAKADTGAEVCLFERKYGEMLGIDLENGEEKYLFPIGTRILAFGHVVTLVMLDIVLESKVYFPLQENLNRNLLGRQGWLEFLNFGLSIQTQSVYLGRA